MHKIKAFVKKNIPTAALVLYAVFLAALAVRIAAALSAPFADAYNRTGGAFFRAVFAWVTAIFPFSIAETLLIAALPLGVWYVLYCIKVVPPARLWRHVFGVLGGLALIFSAFFLNYGAAYGATPLEDKIGLEVAAPSKEDLSDAFTYTAVQLNQAANEVDFTASGASKMPYSFAELTKKLNAAYDKLYPEYDFLTPLHASVKRIALSKPMTYTHLSGIYAVYTGEANVNINYPDFVIVYTTAHEMAHQRGVAPEDEANFIAFLVCTASDDPYIRYCGYANLYEYIADALYSADADAYRAVAAFLDDAVAGEFAAYSKMFAPYSHSTASAVADTVNDTYLKWQGESAGTKSYGLVVDLAVAYLKKQY